MNADAENRRKEIESKRKFPPRGLAEVLTSEILKIDLLLSVKKMCTLTRTFR